MIQLDIKYNGLLKVQLTIAASATKGDDIILTHTSISDTGAAKMSTKVISSADSDKQIDGLFDYIKAMV